MIRLRPPDGRRLTDALNQDCFCVSVDRDALQARLAMHLREDGLPPDLLDEQSRLFSESPVFLWQAHLDAMASLIAAVSGVTRNDAYRRAVFDRSPEIAHIMHGPAGVFSGFDFHLGAEGPQLIEVNTNAGGVLMNAYLAAAQHACCPEVEQFFGPPGDFASTEIEFVEMFRNEWRLQMGNAPLRRIAIVDRAPSEQFLYPEMRLFRAMFKRHGIDAVVADISELVADSRGLRIGDHPVDLVYNRLTDFYFETPECRVLRDAYEQGIVVVTPSPDVYALYADKRNLVLWSDTARLREFGIDASAIEQIRRSLPETTLVTPENAEMLWSGRKQLFFKPATGYGSRGTYRGAKLTRRAWEGILRGNYVAQAAVQPSERHLIVDGERRPMKLDLRCVTYNGEIQQVSARLYRGQTTNLRTAGGGLATVVTTPVG